MAVMVMCLVSFVVAGLSLPDVYTLAMDAGGVKRISMDLIAQRSAISSRLNDVLKATMGALRKVKV